MITSQFSPLARFRSWWKGSDFRELYQLYVHLPSDSAETEVDFVSTARELEIKIYLPLMLIIACLGIFYWPGELRFFSFQRVDLALHWWLFILLNLGLIMIGLSMSRLIRDRFTPIFCLLLGIFGAGLGYVLGGMSGIGGDLTLRGLMKFSWSFVFPLLTFFAVSFYFLQRFLYTVYVTLCPYFGMFVLHPGNVTFEFFRNPSVIPGQVDASFLETSMAIHALIAGFSLVGGHLVHNLYRHSTVLSKNLEEKREQSRNLEQRLQTVETSDDLLLNVFPESVAERLKNEERKIADGYEEVTVLFADIVGFTGITEGLTPSSVVTMLDDIISSFDRVINSYQVEKIKTIGDEYFVTAGIPTQIENHAVEAAKLGHRLITEMSKYRRHGNDGLQLRVGLNSGPVVAGIIGVDKFIYDVWGDTVNLASRMESEGVPGRVQVTEATREAIDEQDPHDIFTFERRGTVEVKGWGNLDTYFVEFQDTDEHGGRTE